MAYVIKVNHKDTLRRLTFEKQPGGDDGLSFAGLVLKIRELFQIPPSAPLKVTYRDEDNDDVTMEKDQDLKDACVLQALNPLRLNVTLSTPDAMPTWGLGTGPTFGFAGLDQSMKDDLFPESVKFDESLKNLMKNLHPENVRNVFQAYEPLFKEVRSAAQIPDLVENIAKMAASQFASLGKVGAGSSTSASSTPGPSPCREQRQSTSRPEHNKETPAPAPAAAASADAPNDSNYNQVPHFGVTCDVCDVHPIMGPRYKSMKKENYDLCSSCYSKVDSSEVREYHRFDRPFRPRHFRSPRSGRMNMCPAMGPVGYTGMSRCPAWGRSAPDGQTGRLDARFVRDVSIFDGTELAPGTRFTKIWRLRNSGAVPWPATTKLVNVDGDDLGSAPVTPLELGEQGLAPEEEIEVSVDCTAPQQTGRFVSYYRLASPLGPKFGHRIWVQIQVVPVESLTQAAEVVGDVEKVPETDAGESSNAAAAAEVTKAAEIAPQSDKTSTEVTHEPQGTNNIEDSFVKVEKDESPYIQMIEMPSGSGEGEKEQQDESSSAEFVEVTTGGVETQETKTPLNNGEEDATKLLDDASPAKALLGRLEAMGFEDRKLNAELLEANKYDLRKTVDALCVVDDWAPALAELEEMGFTDTDVNRRLMFKNQGNVKRVVKDLVQLAKEAAGKAK